MSKLPNIPKVNFFDEEDLVNDLYGGYAGPLIPGKENKSFKGEESSFEAPEAFKGQIPKSLADEWVEQGKCAKCGKDKILSNFYLICSIHGYE